MKKITLLLLASFISTNLLAASYAISTVTLTEQTTLVTKADVKTEAEFYAAYGPLFEKLGMHLADKGIRPTGAPFARYFSFEPGVSISFEVGVPVAGAVPTTADIVPSTLPGGEAATTEHTDGPESVSQAYEALHLWMKDKGREPAGAPWEVYTEDPSLPAGVRLTVFFPLKPCSH